MSHRTGLVGAALREGAWTPRSAGLSGMSQTRKRAISLVFMANWLAGISSAIS